MLLRLLVGVGLAGLVSAGPLAAQQFDISPRLGFVSFKDATGLRESGMLGLEAMYRVSPNIGVGVRGDVARPSTEGDFFPAEMSFGDTTLIFGVQQPVTVMHYGALAQLETGGSLSLFGLGSIGGYAITLDPQAARGKRTFNQWAATAGGGVRLRTSSTTSVRLEVHDLIFLNYERNQLDPVEPRFKPVRFPDVLPVQPEFDGTAHNFFFALSFTFSPGGGQ